MTKTKSNIGNFFEDFTLGQIIRHATPRTVTTGDVGLLHRAVFAAIRGAVLARLRPGDRL